LTIDHGVWKDGLQLANKGGLMLQRAIPAACAALLVLSVVPAQRAQAALTIDQFRCQKTVAKSGRVFFKKRFNALSKCNDKINKGVLDTTTDCELEPKTALKLSKADQKLRDKIDLACISDAVVASLDFGGLCNGVTTRTALKDCQVAEHEAGVAEVLALVYDEDTQRKCVGGMNDTMNCDDTADCPDGKCVLTEEQQFCTKSLAKALRKLDAKRQAVVQSCKKKVAKDKIPLSTNCVAAGQAKLDVEFTKTVTAIQESCPSMVTASLAFGGVCESQTDTNAVASCSTCTVNKNADHLLLVQHGSSALGGTASVEQITDIGDCVGGPMSRCRLNDYLLKNDKIRVVIQDVQRNMFGIGQFGGQIIDGDIVRTSGPDRDSFEEWSISLNVESTAHYTSLTVINDGSNGAAAVLRATGVDDLLDFLNPSSVVAGFGFLLPASANDNNIPVTITTDYILEPGANYVRVETTVQNLGGSTLNIFFGEFINGSGQVEFFQPGYGFGEPLVTAGCPPAISTCNFTAYTGEDDGDGVSYGYIHNVPGSTTFSTSGVNVPQLKVEVILALLGLASPPFSLTPFMTPGDTLAVTRYFVVGDGSVSDVTDARNQIECRPTGIIQGNVTVGGSPAVRADVVVLGNPADGPGATLIGGALQRNVLTHTRTDDLGNYSLTMPPGSYDVVANLDGAPYQGGGSSPALNPVVVTAFGTVVQNIALPATGSYQVTVVDEDGDDSPGKVSIVGFDPSPDPRNFQSLAGLVTSNSGVFGDRSMDGLPHGLAASYFIGASGDSGVQTLEPGTYQMVVSRGTEYSIDSQSLPITAGMNTPIAATVEHVIDTDGFISADYHVHSIDSPDSEVSYVERVNTMLAEGMNFFTPTDHEYRLDFQPTIDAMDVSDLLGTATGQEITTFDYGHFNAWPLTRDLSQVNFGATDHGGAAPDGADYPSSMNYSLTPAAIVADAHADAPGGSNTVQVNHIHSHFGLDGGSGLAIDTGVNPPASAVPALARRLNPMTMNFFTSTFDALEIWIGDDRGQVNTNFLGQNAGDWFNLINQGIYRTGVADSDSHKRTVSPVGSPRTMVASPSDDPGDLSDIADTLSDNVNDGRTIGTNAPMVRVTVEAASTGDIGKLELGFPTTIATTDGAVDVTVDIQSPEWAQFNRVEYYINTTTTRSSSNKQSGAGLVNVKRYAITPDVVHNVAPTLEPVAGTSSNRWEFTDTLSLTSLTEDTWIVVMVKGTDGVSEPLFPVNPNSLKTCLNPPTCTMQINQTLAELLDGNLGEDGVLALAFTNPLFVDVDGGGYTAPGLSVVP
jgi:hypothetical protein